MSKFTSCLFLLFLWVGASAQTQSAIDVAPMLSQFSRTEFCNLFNKLDSNNMLQEPVKSRMRALMQFYQNPWDPVNLDTLDFSILDSLSRIKSQWFTDYRAIAPYAEPNSEGPVYPATSFPTQTTLLNGIADFLAKRFKQELEVAFIERMNKDLNNTPVLKALFPSTIDFISSQAFLNYPSFGATFNAVIKRDFRDMPTNLANFIKEDSVISNEGKQVALQTLSLYNGINDGLSARELLNNATATTSNSDFENMLKLSKLIPENFKSGKPMSSAREANFMLDMFSKNSDNQFWFVVLTYHQNEQAFDNLGMTGAALSVKTSSYFYKMKDINAKWNTILDTTITHTSDTDETELDLALDYYASFEDFFTSVCYLTPDANVLSVLKADLKAGHDLLQMYQYVHANDYCNMVVNTANVLKVLYPETTAELNAFQHYGTFMAEVLAAKSEADVENAIQTFALPAGSYSVKRKSNSTLMLNAYVGGFVGGEAQSGYPNKSTVQYHWCASLTAPIGIDWSMHIPLKPAWSCGVFFSLIDVGALVSYRLQKDTSSSSPAINLRNVFAPGIHFNVGVANTPLTVSFGAQYAPSVEEINGNQVQLQPNRCFRYGAELLIDIPIFKLAGGQPALGKNAKTHR